VAETNRDQEINNLAPSTEVERSGNRALAISLREIAVVLGASKPTASLRLRRHGIAPIRHGTSINCKQWYSRREVERFFRRLGLV
jgi:hypothetical protein